MKYILSEEQNNRIMEIIKKAAENYTNQFVVKTEVEVETKKNESGESYYVLYPKFYVKEVYGYEWEELKRTKPLFKHFLADYVQDLLGFPVHSVSARFQIQ